LLHSHVRNIVFYHHPTAPTAPAANYCISANPNLNTDPNPDLKRNPIPNPNLSFSENALWGEMQLRRKYHRRAVAQLCANGNRLSQWRMAKFDPEIPEPINTKFETGD